MSSRAGSAPGRAESERAARLLRLRALAGRVEVQGGPGELRCVAGADVSYAAPAPEGGGAGPRAVAALAFLAFPSLELLHCELGEAQVDQPYEPGFLAFREAPVVLALLRRAAAQGFVPDLLFVDGNGRLHPERCGLACVVGVLSGLPTIGVAKSLFGLGGLEERRVRADCGRALSERKAGAPPVTLPLAESPGEPALGVAMCGQGGSQRPIYVSVGHRVHLERAVALTGLCCIHRVPEPVRQADLLSRRAAEAPAGAAPALDSTELPSICFASPPDLKECVNG